MLKLDPSLSGFSWPNARACAERCAAAYGQTQRSLESMGVSAQCVANHNTDTEALVINEDGCISIAFRGSSCLRDWIQDFKARQEHPRAPYYHAYDGRPAEIHQGFSEDVESITADLITGVQALACAPAAGSGRAVPAARVPIFVTGHSKGAAEATLFALELQRQGFPIAGVYTFGQPRVGNRAFANLYNETLYEETFRVVNQNDIVPRVPGVLMGYKHCGQEIFLPVGGGWSLNPPLWTVLLSDAIGLWAAYRHEQDVLVADHNIFAYQRQIQNL
jgi:predicted lipase